MKAPLSILGMGACTAVGTTVAQSCAAIRASVCGFSTWDLSHLSAEAEAITAGLVPWLPVPRDNDLFDRLVEMAVLAIDECIADSGIRPHQFILLLGIRDGFRHHPRLDGRGRDLIQAIEHRLQVRFHPDSAVVAQGRPSTFLALAEVDGLGSSDVAGCIVGGVDSYINWYDYRRFGGTFRLKCETVPHGFIPGEGAAFIAVRRRDACADWRTLGVDLLALGFAREGADTTVLSDGHPTGQGLHKALEATLANVDLAESQIDFRVSDLNGESYRNIEALLGVSRFYRTRREHLETWFPAASVGDVGAACGALMVILAATGMRKGYAPGLVAMCEAGGDDGLTAACLLSRGVG